MTMDKDNDQLRAVSDAVIDQVKVRIQSEIDDIRTTSHEIGKYQLVEVRGRLKSLLELSLIEDMEYVALLGLAESYQWGKMQRVPISDTY